MSNNLNNENYEEDFVSTPMYLLIQIINFVLGVFALFGVFFTFITIALLSYKAAVYILGYFEIFL